ncbi:MAG: hypothetical protein IH985_08200 [Planctomycetes bacterium]|nr:hypothetical protein [Planctomycetota bacterium]
MTKKRRRQVEAASQPRGELIAKLNRDELELVNRFFSMDGYMQCDKHDPRIQKLDAQGFLRRYELSGGDHLDANFKLRPWVSEPQWKALLAERIRNELCVPIGGVVIGSRTPTALL